MGTVFEPSAKFMYRLWRAIRSFIRLLVIAIQKQWTRISEVKVSSHGDFPLPNLRRLSGMFFEQIQNDRMSCCKFPYFRIRILLEEYTEVVRIAIGISTRSASAETRRLDPPSKMTTGSVAHHIWFAHSFPTFIEIKVLICSSDPASHILGD